MRRPSVLCWSIIVVLCCAWGCNTTKSSRPFAWFGAPNKQSETSTASKDKAKDENPFKKGDKKEEKPATDKPKTETAVAAADKAKEGDKPKDKPADAAKPAETKPDAAKATTVSHDAETLAFIQTELKDFSPIERAQFEKDLKGLDPALVRSLLRTLRMTRQMGQYAPSRAQDDPSNIALTSGNTTPDGRGNVVNASAERNRTNGLGTVQPWSSQTSLYGDPSGNRPQPPADAQNNASVDPYRTTYANNQSGAGATNSNNSVGVAVDPNAFNSNGTGNSNSQPGFPAQYQGQLPQNGSPSGVVNAQATFPSGTMNSVTPVIYPTGVTVNGQNPNMSNGSTTLPPNSGGNVNAPSNVPNIQVTGVYATPATPPAGASTTPAPSMNPQFNPSLGVQANPATAKWKEDLTRLISVTEASVANSTPGTTDAEKQAYVEQQVYLRMLYLMAGQQQRALETIRDIDGADQEFWQQVFWGLSNYFDNEVMPDPADRSAQTVAQLRTAVQRLEESARLELRNVNFCHKIASFGNYERFQRDEFGPNQDVLVYAEVNNFKSESTSDGQYRTLLRSTIEIYKAGAAGEMVASIPFDPTPDLCFNHRRDYFHSYVVTIPQNITAGPYLLKLRVSDELSGKMAETMLKFTVK